jgi:cytochrome b
MFHWSVAILFVANMTFLDEDSLAHVYAGYALFGIVLVRLIWGVIGTRYARFRSFWPSLKGVKAHVAEYFGGPRTVQLSHNPLGGMMSVFGIGWVDGVHEVLANYATVCVGLHVFGVLVETRRTKIDLIRAMITGRKIVPNDGA